jgi:hypothetical protein
VQKTNPNKNIIITAWFLMLIGSTLPLVIFRELFGINPDWLLPLQTIIFAVVLALTYLIKEIEKVKLFTLMIFLLLSSQWLTNIVQSSKLWQNWFQTGSNNFMMYLLNGQLLRLAAALIIFGVLLFIKKKPKNFFFTMGKLDAEVKPIKYFLTDPSNWKKFGIAFAFYISLGTLTFLLIAGGIPSLSKLIGIIPLIPLIIIFAAVNSFYEELGYRAALISVLEDKIGSKHSLYLTSIFFGIGHFYGVPYGIVGVAMASFLGYLLGKSMLETRGFFWAFFIHMLQDIIIFYFIAFNMI